MASSSVGESQRHFVAQVVPACRSDRPPVGPHVVLWPVVHLVQPGQLHHFSASPPVIGWPNNASGVVLRGVSKRRQGASLWSGCSEPFDGLTRDVGNQVEVLVVVQNGQLS